MTVTTPLTEFAETEVARATAALEAARDALAARDTALPDLRTAAADALEAAGASRAREAELRALLATAPLPADADDLSDKLEQNLVTQQADARRLAAAQDALAAAERERAAAAARLASRQAEAATAAAASSAAKAEAKRVEAWLTALSADGVTAAVAAAKSATTAEPYTAARERLRVLLDNGAETTAGTPSAAPSAATTDAPAEPSPAARSGPAPAVSSASTESPGTSTGPGTTTTTGTTTGASGDTMVDLLRLRAADAAAATASVHARAAVAERAWAEAGADADRAVTAAPRSRDAAVERVRSVASDTEARLAAALASLTAIPVAGGGPATTVAEQGRMDGYRKSALAVVDRAEAVRRARKAVREAEDALDTATVRLLAADPAADPATADALQAERTALTDARTTEQQAHDAVIAKDEHLTTARKAVRDAQDALDAATAELLAADPAADPATADALQAQRTALADARTAERQARDALTGGKPTELSLWEIAVPQPVRSAVVAFFAAETTIAELAGIDVTAVARNLADADAALVAALEAASLARRAGVRTAEELALRRAAADEADALATGRISAAVRGER